MLKAYKNHPDELFPDSKMQELVGLRIPIKPEQICPLQDQLKRLAAEFADCCAYDKGEFIYKVRRCGHIREPLSTNLLAAFSRYLSRDAYEHDYSAD